MTTKAWAREMALYNKWQNDGLFSLCDGLPDEERRGDRGMFFNSIHHTLDHMLMVDGRLMGYVTAGQPPNAPFEPRKIVYTEYAQLKSARMVFDTELLRLIDGNSDDWLDETVTLEKSHLGRPRTAPRQLYLAQVFNHGTHHRAQITSELHRMGIDYGNTDLPFNPHSQF